MLQKDGITLIIPPSPFLTDEQVFPTLGILKVASILEERGTPVEVMDLSGFSNYEEIIKEHTPYDIVGITATTPQFPQAVRIASILNERGAKTILGGSHATMVGAAYGRDKVADIVGRGTFAYNQIIGVFDTVVLGDGEEAIFEAIDSEEQIIHADRLNDPFFLKDLSLYPYPARDLIDLNTYHYTIDGREAQSLIVQLGCPFGCLFCGGRNVPSFRKLRTRTAEHVMGEIDEVVRKYHRTGFMFYDDELNISNEGLLLLLEELIKYQEKNNLDLRFRGFVRTDLFTQEQADMMYRAGFRVLLSGVESGSDTVLEAMNKRTTSEVNRRWIDRCRKSKIQSKALMSLGHPGESESTISESLEWILSTRPDDVDWTIITEFPGSPYFDESIKNPQDDSVWVYTSKKTGESLYSKELNYTKEASYYKGIPGSYSSFVWTDYLSPERLVEMRDLCEKISKAVLDLPPIQSVVAEQFEHSMGALPTNILRKGRTG